VEPAECVGDMSAGHTVPGNRNIITGAWHFPFAGLDLPPIRARINENTTFKLLNYPDSDSDDANAAAWITGSNAGSATETFHAGTNQFLAGTSCP